MSVHGVVTWMAATPASTLIQNVGWIIPTVQSIHILCIAVVMSSALLINLRLIGLVGRGDAIASFAHRYLPWMWIALVILLISGSILVLGEPDRSLTNPTFIVKMALVMLAVTLTAIFQRPLLKDLLYWESSSRRRRVRTLGWTSLALWTAIVFCGRWIAYTQ